MTGQEREQRTAHEDGHAPKPHSKRGGTSDRPTRKRDTEDQPNKRAGFLLKTKLESLRDSSFFFFYKAFYTILIYFVKNCLTKVIKYDILLV